MEANRDSPEMGEEVRWRWPEAVEGNSNPVKMGRGRKFPSKRKELSYGPTIIACWMYKFHFPKENVPCHRSITVKCHKKIFLSFININRREKNTD